MDRTNEITLVLGRKGSGKSYLCRKLVNAASRRIIIDPMRESVSGAVVKSFPALVEYLRRVRRGRFSVILRAMDIQSELDAIALTVAGEPDNPPLPDTTLYVDEIDRLCSPSQIPEPLFRLANYGRHFRISLIGAARRPKRIHHDLTANADRLLIGALMEPADADYFREYIGDELAERVREISERFAAAPDDKKPHEFVHWPRALAV